MLRRFYLERGYIDVQVLSATSELARDRAGFFLSFTISEGERYDFGNVSVSSSIPGLNAADFQPLLAPVATAASTTSSSSTASSSAWPSRPGSRATPSSRSARR